MSSAFSYNPTHRTRGTTGSAQERNLLLSKALQDDQATSMAIGDPGHSALAMIGTWATENSQNINRGLNGHVGNNHGTTGYGTDADSRNRHGMGGQVQHASAALGTSVPDLRAAKMQDGPSHQPVLSGDLSTRVSHTSEAANNKPRRADPGPLQRWVDENAKEGPWNSESMQRDKA